MATSQNNPSFSFQSRASRDTREEERDRKTMFEVFHGIMREKIIVQRLTVIARLPHNADRTELGAHYKKLNLELSKQHIWDNMTGLLLIYPSCLLHIIESSRDILVSVLKDLRDMQDQTDSTLLEDSKVVFMVHDPQSRLFQKWTYKVLDADQLAGAEWAKGVQEEEESTETLVCTLLSALQNLSKQLEISKTPELIIPQQILIKLLARDELQTPQQYLQMYNSHLNISMDFGQTIRSSCLTTV